MKKTKPLHLQTSQVSSIKGRNSPNDSKDYSFLRFSKTSNKPEQDMNLIERFLTSFKKADTHQQQVINQNFRTFTPQKLILNQKKFNNSSVLNNHNSNMKSNSNTKSVSKKSQEISSNGICTSTFNSINANYAIQSEPNQMKVSFSSYFEETTYQSRVVEERQQEDENNKLQKIKQLNLQTHQKFSCLKIVSWLQNLNHITYIKKFVIKKLTYYSITNYQNYTKTLQTRQYHFIDLTLPPKQQQYQHKKIYQNLNLIYTNKLVGLCNPQLIITERDKIITKNIQKQKKRLEKRLLKSAEKKQKFIQETERSGIEDEKSFIYNFNVVPQYPFRSNYKGNQKDIDGLIFKRVT